MITEIDQNTALVLIDLQKGIIKIESAHPMGLVLENAATLIDAFRNAGLPVVIVNVNSSGASWQKTRKDLNTNRINLPPDYAEIVDEIKTQPNDIFITKQTWNAFYNTQLHDELQKLNITGIILAGVATSIGVEGTARSASEMGYNIGFAIDAMTDFKMEAHLHSVGHFFPMIGETGFTSEIVGILKKRE